MNQTIIQLQSLHLINFKGVEDFTLELNGKNADVYGRNATYKSTIYNSSQWLLFGKDSDGRSDYQIKPQDKDGNEIHHLESSVEGIFLVNGKSLKLKRQLSEKWVKKRGSQETIFDGNETSYWVNDVPVKAKDYVLEINLLIKENIFKLLTNPLFFNTDGKGWTWQERRKILFEISGNLSDSGVIDSCVTASDKSMLDLLTVINSGRTIENHKLVIAEKIKNTKKDLDGIPARISEQQRSISVDEVDYTAIETSLQEQKATLQGIELELATNAQGASLYRQKQQQAYALQNQINGRKLELEVKAGAESKKLVDEKANLEGEKYSISKEVSRLGSNSLVRIAELDAIAGKIIELRKEWSEENSRQFVAPEGFNCPTCEQPLPEGKTQEKIDKLKENFDKDKVQALASIRAKGKDKAARAEVLNEEKEIDSASLSTLEESLKRINIRLSELETAITEQQQPTVVNYDADSTYSVFKATLDRINVELDKPVEDTTTEILARKQEIADTIEALNKTLNQKEVVEKAHIRINELKAEESKLAQELSEYERHDFLIKQFTSAKVKMLEDRINSKFETVKFKLFDTLNDGTEKEVCRTLVDTNGVLVEFDGANNGGKINTGLEIINLLSEFYGVSCPIFVDNAESLSSFVGVNSQVIKLIVSVEDPILRVEVQE
ncbi:conserved hypothetical protein [Candidatus Desulfosporosinus infrequens]|uniref:Uncharacterized protein n=1 Tax=Candidatus Desulfosporosinus infrequens TaxID=2043169 RepID=A0A2U3LHA2_9FIRM|nr:conserved hypothetical protein [Candidatus Desulfosporosinus infrequens]